MEYIQKDKKYLIFTVTKLFRGNLFQEAYVKKEQIFRLLQSFDVKLQM